MDDHRSPKTKAGLFIAQFSPAFATGLIHLRLSVAEVADSHCFY